MLAHNKMLVFFAYSIIQSLTLSTTLRAELVNCDGTWSNKPCEGKVIQTVSEAPSTAAKIETNTPPATNSKLQILNKLETIVFDARRKLKQEIPIQTLKDYCNAATTDLVECQLKVEDKILAIQKLLTETKTEKTEVSIVDNTHNSNIVVIQEFPQYIERPRNKRKKPRKKLKFEEGPFAEHDPFHPPPGPIR